MTCVLSLGVCVLTWLTLLPCTQDARTMVSLVEAYARSSSPMPIRQNPTQRLKYTQPSWDYAPPPTPFYIQTANLLNSIPELSNVCVCLGGTSNNSRTHAHAHTYSTHTHVHTHVHVLSVLICTTCTKYARQTVSQVRTYASMNAHTCPHTRPHTCTHACTHASHAAYAQAFSACWACRFLDPATLPWQVPEMEDLAAACTSVKEAAGNPEMGIPKVHKAVKEANPTWKVFSQK